MTEQKTLRVVSSIVGAGKTHQLIQTFDYNRRNSIIACPTLALCKQTAENLKHRNPAFIQSGDGENVISALSMEIRCGTGLIIVTHRAIELLGLEAEKDSSLFQQLLRWDLYLDEHVSPISVGQCNPKKLTNVSNFSDYWLITEEGKAAVKPGYEPELWELLDDYYSGVSEVKDFTYTALTNGACRITTNDSGKLFLSWAGWSPLIKALQGFNSVMLLCANASDSPLATALKECHGWRIENAPVEFWPSGERNTHHNQHNVTLYAALTKTTGLSTLGKDNCELYKKVCEEIAQHIGSEPFIYASNKNKSIGDFTRQSDHWLAKGVRVPFITSGLNRYAGLMDSEELELSGKEIDHVDSFDNGFDCGVWLGVSLLNNTHKNLISELALKFGGSGQKMIQSLQNFMTCENAYQMIGRTTVRNRDKNNEVKLYFLDADTRDYIHKNYFPNAKCISLNVSVEKKSDKTRIKVQELKSEGYRQIDVAALLKCSLRSVKNYWKG